MIVSSPAFNSRSSLSPGIFSAEVTDLESGDGGQFALLTYGVRPGKFSLKAKEKETKIWK